MQRRVLVLLAGGLVGACGGEQKGPRGPAFCATYEERYIESCLQQCEAELDLQDQAGRTQCQADCQEDLRADGTWSEDCAQ